MVNKGDRKHACTRANCSQRENWEYVTTTALLTPRSMEKEGDKVLQVMEQKFPCSPQRFMLEQISTCRLWRTPCWSRWMTERRL